MEYLEGEDLAHRLKKNLFTANEIFQLMAPIFDTLEKVHRQGIVHRDISPDNIMMLPDGSLKLMDFGAARLMNYEDQRSISVVLKAGYAPEEQYRTKGEQGPWTDVYALCATIYKCITGITPDDALERSFEDSLKWPSELGYPITMRQEAMLKKGMAIRKKDRFQSIGELKDSLNEETDGSSVSGPITIEPGLQPTKEPLAPEKPPVQPRNQPEFKPESVVPAPKKEPVAPASKPKPAAQSKSSQSKPAVSSSTKAEKAVRPTATQKKSAGKLLWIVLAAFALVALALLLILSGKTNKQSPNTAVPVPQVSSKTEQANALPADTSASIPGEVAKTEDDTVQQDSWGVIGNFEGTNWDTDFPMTEQEPGVWVSDPLDLKAGDEFKVRANGVWGFDYGITDGKTEAYGDNVKVEADGIYTITLDLNTEDLFMTKQQADSEVVDLAGEYTITIWCSGSMLDLTKKQVEAFNTSNDRGIRFHVTFQSVNEAEAPDRILMGEPGGDIFFFPHDQLGRLVYGDILHALDEQGTSFVRSENVEAAVDAATCNGKAYAYPVTADNTFFVFYDKRAVKEDSLNDIWKMIADCEAANKTFCFDLKNGWYLSSFFFGVGCNSIWETDTDGTFVAVHDTFNSDMGFIAAKAMNMVMNSDKFISTSEAYEFDNHAGFIVSGTWHTETAKQILGDNFGVAPLPKFTMNGVSYQLSPFTGCKLLGVKTHRDRKLNAACHLLAQYLSGEKAQVERFEAFGWGPSNIIAAKSDKVLADPVLGSIAMQAPYSVNLGTVPADWWTNTQILGETLQNATSDADIRAALKAYEESLSR